VPAYNLVVVNGALGAVGEVSITPLPLKISVHEFFDTYSIVVVYCHQYKFDPLSVRERAKQLFSGGLGLQLTHCLQFWE
jgi:hypothetical protein